MPASIVPAALGQGTLSVAEDTKARKRFAVAGSKSLVSEGRLYTIRQGMTLVGALQVATVKPKLNLSCEKDRKSVASNLLPGSKQTINIARTDVITSDTNDKTLFVWFDRELFEVLQLKGSRIDPDAIINELVTFQTQQKGLATPSPNAHPLPLTASPFCHLKCAPWRTFQVTKPDSPARGGALSPELSARPRNGRTRPPPRRSE